jgi:trehalose 6-phosphate synthase/phosphatase
MSKRLITISNRLPFCIDTSESEITIRQSSGGLVSAIKSYIEDSNASTKQDIENVWIGTLDSSPEDWQMAGEVGALPEDFIIEPVFVDDQLYKDYYNGFSNSTLWPLFHYFPSLAEYKQEYFDAYEKINQQFADEIIKKHQPGDIIWVHDYQLMLVPQMVRNVLPDATIGFFSHIPFPSYEMFRLIPTSWKKKLLHGILGADLIGFHTHDYVQHFIQSAKMVLNVENHYHTIHYNGRLIKADLFPIGIDYNKFRRYINNEVVDEIAAGIKEKFADQKIIFSVDRLDYTKGLNYRLDSYYEFLQRHPEWIEKVVFIFNIVPSRDAIPAYSDRKRKIEEQISTINGKLSTLQWQPIIYRYNHLSFEELCALYQLADVALITPLRDGMNLVAKEYIASCVDKGVLILSELAGAANELNEALLVNPTDVSEVANAIATALDMPQAQQRSRLSYMQERIAEYNVSKWIDEFIYQLNEIKTEQKTLAVKVLDNSVVSRMALDFEKANSRCILLDYDGTLTPIQKLPSLANPNEDILNLLTDLANDPLSEVVVISGRDANTLDSWLGHLQLTLVAEHGAEIKYKNQQWQQQVSLSSDWKDQIKPLLELYVTRCAGSFIEEKKNTLAWHYRNTHADLGFIRSRELRNNLLQLTINRPLQVIDGNKVLEVRMMGIDKGTTVQKILNEFKPEFVFCIGDDVTDEDMFRILRGQAYTVKIGSGNTAAEYTLTSQTQVVPLLKRLIAPVEKQKLTLHNS